MDTEPDAFGISSGWWSTDGSWQKVVPETMSALRSAQDAQDAQEQSDGPPQDAYLWFVHQGEAEELLSEGMILLEDGGEVHAQTHLPTDLPLGAHLLQPMDGGPTTSLFVVPRHSLRPKRSWGWSTQLYATRSANSWGQGDFVDLAELANWSQRTGASLLAHNPLGASLPLAHQQPSPYYASSRGFLSPLYLRVESVTGADLIGDQLTQAAAAGRELNRGQFIDRDKIWALKLAVLESIWAEVRSTRAVQHSLAIAVNDVALTQHAQFCALAEHHGSGWQEWPDRFQHPDSTAVQVFCSEQADRVSFWQWIQVECETQLLAASRAGSGLLADLPVGFDPNGSDAWRFQALLALDCKIGAPPDEFNQQGQDWGLPPFVPWKLRHARYAPWLETLRRVLKHCDTLRIDHVMGLFRLFWIPEGMTPASGGYVSQFGAELLDLAVMEATRAGATLVGEDLGTVEAGVRSALSDRDVFGYRIGLFAEDPPERWPATTLCSLTTHDLPTTAGLWTGADAEQRAAAEIPPDPLGDQLLRSRLAGLAGVAEDASVSSEQIVVSAYRSLARSGSDLAIVPLEDATGALERPNLPGTIDEH
ncbi:MAG: 4-alpha-glucanotransferase, partial [Microthrixaceae bacterium]